MATSVTNVETLEVASKSSWSDSWAVEPYVYPIWIAERAAPSISEALIAYDYGRIIREDQSSYAQFDPPDLENKFVRINKVADDGTKTGLFVGWVPASGIEPHSPIDGQPGGVYRARVQGLETLLDDKRVWGTEVENGSSRVTIGETLAFNVRTARGLDNAGNRSSTQYSSGNGLSAYIFADSGSLWNGRQIAEYLLAFFGSERATISLGGQSAMLENVQPIELDLTGLTVREALNQVVDRRRAAGWNIRIDTNGDLFVHVFSVLGSDLATDNITIPANDEQVPISTDIKEVRGFRLNRNVLTQYDAVEARGERLQVITTMEHKATDSTLEPLWTNTEEDNYRAASPEARQLDKYRHVFTSFYVPDNSLLLSGESNPTINDSGEIDETTEANVRQWGHIVLRQLPKAKDWSGSADKEFREPFAVVKDGNDKWRYCDRLSEIELNSAQFRPLDTVLGFELLTPINHQFALNHWDSSSDLDVAPALDWQNIKATVAVETDEVLRYRVAIAGGPGVGRVLRFRVPGAQAWWIPAGTVTDVNDDGTLATQGTGQELRNDKDELKSFVALARAWYSPVRSTIDISYDLLETATAVGQYITQTLSGGGFNDDKLNSVVTEKQWDLLNFTTRIRTSFEELDL